MLREEKLQKQINELNVKLSMANARHDTFLGNRGLSCHVSLRSENSEMDIGRLNVRIDKVGQTTFALVVLLNIFQG